MAENDKGHGFMDIIKDGLGFISQIITASIIPPIAESAEVVMKNIEERIIRIEKRILRKLTSFVILGVGILFLIFALLFFLIEYIGWSHTAAFFSIGITIFVIGLLIKLKESDNESSR